MATDKNYLLSLSNDCTIRKWDYETGINESIFKFGHPVEIGLLNKSETLLYTASWDKMVRVVDLETNKVQICF